MTAKSKAQKQLMYSPPATGMQEAPLCIYHERRLEGVRVFELFPERIRVQVDRYFGPKADTTIKLCILNPSANRVWVRSKSFQTGLWLLIAAGILWVFFSGGFSRKLGSVRSSIVTEAAVGLGLMLATFRRVEYASFTSLAGVTLLDIARSGPDKAGFDSFTQHLITQIQRAGSIPVE